MTTINPRDAETYEIALNSPDSAAASKTNAIVAIDCDSQSIALLQNAAGHSQIQATHGNEAFALVNKETRTVVVRLASAQISAMQVLPKIRKSYPSARIIVLAGDDELQEVAHAFLSGGIRFASNATSVSQMAKLLTAEPTERETDEPFSLVGKTLQAIEREAIIQTLKSVDGNKAKTARILGISEKSIYNKMKRLNIGPTKSGS